MNVPRETSTVYYNRHINIKSKYNVNSWKKHSPGVGYPSSCNISLGINNDNLNELKGRASPLEAMLEKQTNIGELPRSIHRMKKPIALAAETTGKNPGPMDSTSRPAGLGLDMNQG